MLGSWASNSVADQQAGLLRIGLSNWVAKPRALGEQQMTVSELRIHAWAAWLSILKAEQQAHFLSSYALLSMGKAWYLSSWAAGSVFEQLSQLFSSRLSCLSAGSVAEQQAQLLSSRLSCWSAMHDWAWVRLGILAAEQQAQFLSSSLSCLAAGSVVYQQAQLLISYAWLSMGKAWYLSSWAAGPVAEQLCMTGQWAWVRPGILSAEQHVQLLRSCAWLSMGKAWYLAAEQQAQLLSSYAWLSMGKAWYLAAEQQAQLLSSYAWLSMGKAWYLRSGAAGSVAEQCMHDWAWVRLGILAAEQQAQLLSSRFSCWAAMHDWAWVRLGILTAEQQAQLLSSYAWLSMGKAWYLRSWTAGSVAEQLCMTEHGKGSVS